MEQLFELELQYREDAERISSPEGRIGEYLGSGDGKATGERIQGTVKWDLYEVVGEDRCETNFVGEILTGEGARIGFEAVGFGIVPDRSAPKMWSMNAAVRLESEADGYEWLNSILAVWDGQFDMEVYQHNYHVFAETP